MSIKQLECELNISQDFAEKACFNLIRCTSKMVLDIFHNYNLLPPDYYFEDYKSHISDIELIKAELKRREIP